MQLQKIIVGHVKIVGGGIAFVGIEIREDCVHVHRVLTAVAREKGGVVRTGIGDSRFAPQGEAIGCLMRKADPLARPVVCCVHRSDSPDCRIKIHKKRAFHTATSVKAQGKSPPGLLATIIQQRKGKIKPRRAVKRKRPLA